MQIEIIKNLFFFGETTTILFILIRFYFSCVLHLKVNFYFSLYKYIVWLEMSTRKYASGYEKLKKEKRKKKKKNKLSLKKDQWINLLLVINKI